MRARHTVAAVLATAAALSHSSHAAITMVPLWQVDMGTRTYMPNQSVTQTNTERGIAYNPVTNHVYVVSRATNAGTSPVNTLIGVVNAADGADAGFSLNTTGIPASGTGTAGTFNVNKIGAATDGSIYVANLTTATTGGILQIYRWANEAAAPTNVVSLPATISGTTTGRFGDTMDLRTLSNGTIQAIFGRGTTGTEVEMLQSTDGVNWTSKLLTVTGAANADFSGGIAFGEGDSFWGKQPNSATNMRRVAFDFTAGTASVTNSYPTADFDSAIGPIDVNPDAQLLAGIVTGSANKVQVFDISGPPTQLLSSNPYAEGVMNTPAFANGNKVGQVVFGANPFTLYALQTNNSLFAFSVPEPGSVGLIAIGAVGLLARRRRV